MDRSNLQKNVENALEIYGSMLYRLGLSMMNNSADAEDAVQETMLKYLKSAPVFDHAEHEKAWLIRVCTNTCRDMLRKKKHRHETPDSAIPEISVQSPEAGILDILSQLPEKFRLVLTLHYSEGYSVNEIAHIIRRTPSTVKMRLQKGRKMIKNIYERSTYNEYNKRRDRIYYAEAINGAFASKEKLYFACASICAMTLCADILDRRCIRRPEYICVVVTEA